jgi:hypothetical protein
VQATNKELEKFKYVLDYKLPEMRKDAEPKEEAMGAMRETIRELDAEMQREYTSTLGLEAGMAERAAQVEAAQVWNISFPALSLLARPQTSHTPSAFQSQLTRTLQHSCAANPRGEKTCFSSALSRVHGTRTPHCYLNHPLTPSFPSPG